MHDIIRNIPLFSDLGDEEIRAIAGIVFLQQHKKNVIVVQEGEPGDSMAIIIKGSVKVSSYAADGREVVLCLLGKGAFFGEMALLDAEPRSATVTTMEETELGRIRRTDFKRLMLQMPQLTLKLLSEVVYRLRRTSSILAHISTMDVPQRLYVFISEHCEKFGSQRADGSVEITLPTQQLLADQISTSRETVSRAISVLKKEKIITPLPGRGRVRINKHALDELIDAVE